VEELGERYYEYKRRGLHDKATRDAWLAGGGSGDSGSGIGGDGEQHTRIERYRQLYEAYLERQRLYKAAPAQQKKQQLAAEVGKTAGDGADNVSWMEHLTPEEREQAEAVRPLANQYKSLGLNRVATREAWLAEDPDAVDERRAMFERLRPQYNEFNCLHAKAMHRRRTAYKAERSLENAPRSEKTPVTEALQQGDAAVQENIHYDLNASDARAVDEGTRVVGGQAIA
jgi:hypothetical protein